MSAAFVPHACHCEFGSDDPRCCIAKARVCENRIHQHKREKPKGRWLKVECLAFLPEGEELSRNFGDYLVLADGFNSLGFTHMDDLIIKEIE